ncbi:MAG: molecular chaperone DjiA [Paracoccus sp.]|uniref:molecular chaperone DjiA n=1 Tax=Paracoccus TaxID=265 RepID=UPI00086B7A01|nr:MULTISPECIES: molecular chaperone DjiA [Paracoccus]MCG6110823.1 molecular chaperone DjiA [Paracoccus sp. (in: a-proteobacteria)]ODT58814.1 MAG: molecular chaperone DjlA [Paracoccus sp. SCN 68-21]
MDCCTTPETCTGPCPELPRPRSFWQRMADRITAFLWTNRPATPPERSVAFTIAVIALGAKLAKVDGTVERSEVAAFRRVFIIPRSEEKNAARVFDLARQDVAGFDAWARKMASMFQPGDPVLLDVMEGLFVIAVADGALHEAEIQFLDEVGRIFGLAPEQIAAIRRRHDSGAGCPPCEVLGVAPDTPLPEVKRRWRQLVRENHPDQAIGRGLPPEAIRLAEARTRRLNEAWESYRDLYRRNLHLGAA